jgi:hypothetical protein
MDAAETAREALRVLDRDGWCKGSLSYNSSPPGGVYPGGSHCLGGAWNIADHGTVLWDTSCPGTYEPVADVIRAQYPQYSSDVSEAPCLIMWMNDADPTTEADVRAILEKLAADDAAFGSADGAAFGSAG